MQNFPWYQLLWTALLSFSGLHWQHDKIAYLFVLLAKMKKSTFPDMQRPFTFLWPQRALKRLRASISSIKSHWCWGLYCVSHPPAATNKRCAECSDMPRRVTLHIGKEGVPKPRQSQGPRALPSYIRGMRELLLPIYIQPQRCHHQIVRQLFQTFRAIILIITRMWKSLWEVHFPNNSHDIYLKLVGKEQIIKIKWDYLKATEHLIWFDYVSARCRCVSDLHASCEHLCIESRTHYISVPTIGHPSMRKMSGSGKTRYGKPLG